MAGVESTRNAKRNRWYTRHPGRWWRWILRATAVLAALAILLAILVDTPSGHRLVVRYIEDLEPQSGLRIGVGEITGSLYGKAELHDVVLSDPEGEFLQVPLTELDWRPLNWIFGELDIRNVSFRQGRLFRLPSLDSSMEETPSVPEFDLRVDRFEIDGLSIAPGVAGKAREVHFLASGLLRDDTVRLNVSGELGGEDKLQLGFNAVPDQDRFDFELDYSAPEGGLLAGLTGAEGDWRARASGDGSWTRWDGSISVRQAEKEFAGFELSNRAGLFGLRGKILPNGNLADLAGRAAGKSVAMSIEGRFEDRQFDGNFALETSALRGGGKGRIDLSESRFDQFAVELILLDPKLIGDDIRLDGARANATLDGDFNRLNVSHRIEIAEVTTAPIELREVKQQGIASFDGRSWDIALDLTAGKIATGLEEADAALVSARIGGNINFTGPRFRSDSIRLDSAKLSSRVRFDGDLARQNLAAAGRIKASGLTMQGVGRVNAGLHFALQGGSTLPRSLEARISGNASHIDSDLLKEFAGPNLAFEGKISSGKASSLLLTGVKLESERLNLSVDGQVRDGSASLAGAGQHEQFGHLTFVAAIEDGKSSATIGLDSPYPSAGLEDVRIALTSMDNGYSVETKGGSALGPFDGKMRLLLPGNQPARIAVDQFDIWKTRINGALTLEDGFVIGDLNLAGGGMEGRTTLSRLGDDTQGYAVAISANAARFGGQTPISIARARIDASGTMSGKHNKLDGTIHAQGVSYGQLFLGQLSAKVGLADGRGTVSLSMAGQQGSDFDIKVRADIEPELALIVAQGEFEGNKITMPRPARLEWLKGSGWKLHRSQLSLNGGFLQAEAEANGAESLHGEVSLSNVPLALFGVALSESGIHGIATGNVEWASKNDHPPEGTMRIKIADFSRSGLTLTSQPIDITVNVDLTGRQLVAKAVAADQGRHLGRMSVKLGDLPVSGGLLDRLYDGSLSGNLQFKGEASSLWRMTGIETFDVTGPIDLRARATGRLADPKISGALQGDGLRISSVLTGTDIRNLSVRSNFAGSRIEIASFSGTTGRRGSVSGSGTIDFGKMSKHGPKIDIKLAAKNARLFDRSDIAATVSGPLRIYSDGKSGTIAGRLTIERTQWRLGSASPDEALPLIDFREANLPPDRAPARSQSVSWQYMIDAVADDLIEVEGLGLQSEWSANIRLRGRVEDPRIGGQARLRRGNFDFAGTTFEVSHGEMIFDEATAPDPILNVLAETFVDNLEVYVEVVGNASAPEINIRSTPPLAEEELLSRLLYGGSTNELSAINALKLGTAVASLKSGGGMGPVNKLRRAVGLDRLKLLGPDPTIDRGTAIAAGKHFSKRFYAELVTDGNKYSATQLEFRLTNWLSLLATTSSIRRDKAGIEYRKDY